MFEAWLTEWLHLLTRWFHLVVGAAWIGASFYFNWLNNHVRPPEDDATGELKGELFAVHGGAFYKVSKYKGAPSKLPTTLHWFKYEAYFTWISGVTLMLLVYWMQAGANMVPAGDAPLSPNMTAGVGVGALVVGWLAYDLMCRSPLVKYPKVLAALGFAGMTAASWGLSQVMSPRAAYIHVGAMLGTMMALNVFFVIIPGQRAMVDAMVKGDEPDVRYGQAGSLRSLHNNYLTLPVLFIMVSNHFPFTYGHQWGWVLLLAIAVIGAGVRHWFNLKGQGHKNVWILPLAAVAMAGLAFVSNGPRPGQASAPVPEFSEVRAILDARCVTCHIAEPTFAGITAPPLGLLLDDDKVVQQKAALIRSQAVATQTMPLANVTGMTEEERAVLGAWIDGGAPLK